MVSIWLNSSWFMIKWHNISSTVTGKNDVVAMLPLICVDKPIGNRFQTIQFFSSSDFQNTKAPKDKQNFEKLSSKSCRFCGELWIEMKTMFIEFHEIFVQSGFQNPSFIAQAHLLRT